MQDTAYILFYVRLPRTDPTHPDHQAYCSAVGKAPLVQLPVTPKAGTTIAAQAQSLPSIYPKYDLASVAAKQVSLTMALYC